MIRPLTQFLRGFQDLSTKDQQNWRPNWVPLIQVYAFQVYPLVNLNVNKKRTGKIHHAINGKSAISMAIFNSHVKLPEGKHCKVL
jgi:hypothetical protein